MSKDRFNEDAIRRTGLPDDVFGILHDLAWSHVGQKEWKWEHLILRAQSVLMSQIPSPASGKPYEHEAADVARNNEGESQ